MVLSIGIAVTVLIILYLLAIMPNLTRNPDLKKLEGWYYAHRGLHDNLSDAPENSLKAFQLAVDNNFGIELDVQITKDQVPIVLHDYNLLRACNKNLKVANLTYEEIKVYNLFHSKEKIPTLQEALDVIAAKVPIIIELKIPWSAPKTCEAVVNILECYTGVYCIESFHPFGLIWYRKNKPNIVRGQLASDFIKEKTAGSKFQYFILKHLLLNFLSKPDFIAYHYIYKNDLSFTLCRKLYKVKAVAWTIQSQKDLEDNKDIYHLFIFDSFLPDSK